MKTVYILGGGFAGLAAAQHLSRHSNNMEVHLIDQRSGHHFLPLLPDIIGRSFPSDILVYPYEAAQHHRHFTFHQETIEAVDTDKHIITTSHGRYQADFILISAGSVTNYHGQDELRADSLPFHSIENAQALEELVVKNTSRTFVISGGGYTGVEIATAIRRRARRENPGSRLPEIHLVDLAPALCNTLETQLQRCVHREVASQNIETHLETSVTHVEDQKITLANGTVFNNACLVWSAGMCPPVFVRNLDLPKKQGGRLVVDPALQVKEGVFAAGDSACFMQNNQPLRMSVQFALSMGQCAAENILRSFHGKPLHPFSPYDPGFIVPMSHGKACGRVLGIPVTGRVPSMLHYMLSSFRSWGTAHRLAVLRSWLRSCNFIKSYRLVGPLSRLGFFGVERTDDENGDENG